LRSGAIRARGTVFSSEGREVMTDSQRRALRVVAIVLFAAAVLTIGPYWAPLLIAAWAADMLQPVVRRLQRMLGGRRRGAAAIVVLLLAAVLIPLAGVTAALVVGVGELLTQLRATLEGRETLGGVLLGGNTTSLRDWADLLSRYGANAWRALTLVARTSASALLGAIVFVVSLYALAASGAGSYRWLLRNSPLAPRDLSRFTRAFRETGRGLILAGGGTALVQGLIATVAYVALGIPRALLLGPVTAVCALIPIVGTGVVWVPLAVELAVTGDYVRAGAIVVVGAVVGLIDNFIRPVLTKHGRLNLPIWVLLVSMLGGLAVFGAAGVLVGPLAVRLAVEALAITRESGRPHGPARGMQTCHRYVGAAYVDDAER
jgi:predicted PurR-regulated permease PerM